MKLPRLRRRLHLRKHRRDAAHRKHQGKRARREAAAVRKLRRLIARLIRRRSGPTQMYDSVDLSQIPRDAPAVAGYVGGQWPTYKRLNAEFPKARHLSIAVASRLNADMLDIENGDAEPRDAPRWAKRQHKRGAKRPAVYASVSEMDHVLGELAAHGIARRQLRVVTAHYGAGKHRCGPKTCGLLRSTTADGTQFTDKALGRNLDESVLARDFWD